MKASTCSRWMPGSVGRHALRDQVAVEEVDGLEVGLDRARGEVGGAQVPAEAGRVGGQVARMRYLGAWMRSESWRWSPPVRLVAAPDYTLWRAAC